MKYTSKIRIGKAAKLLMATVACWVLFCLIESCGVRTITIISAPPATVNAGETITTVLKVRYDYSIFDAANPPSPFKYLIVGMLVPKKWNGNAPGNTTMTYTSPIGNGILSKISDDEKVPNTSVAGLTYPEYFKRVFGIGKNALDDHEWVVYKSDKQYSLIQNQKVDAEFTITTKTGPDNVRTKLAYIFTISNEAVTLGSDLDANIQQYQALMSDDCFEVINGNGVPVELCSPQLSSVTPLSAFDKDFITFNFDNSLINTPLSDNTEIYVCATAELVDGSVIERCNEYKDRLHLKPIGNNKYSLIIYPRDIFDLTENQTIAKMKYWVTDGGSERVGKTETTQFLYEFTMCN